MESTANLQTSGGSDHRLTDSIGGFVFFLPGVSENDLTVLEPNTELTLW